jgi:hypothetical protein
MIRHCQCVHILKLPMMSSLITKHLGMRTPCVRTLPCICSDRGRSDRKTARKSSVRFSVILRQIKRESGVTSEHADKSLTTSVATSLSLTNNTVHSNTLSFFQAYLYSTSVRLVVPFLVLYRVDFTHTTSMPFNTALTRALGIRVPVVQGGMQWVRTCAAETTNN